MVPVSLSANQINDSDGDGLSDQYENTIGTEAYLKDTDGDGVNDGIEVGSNKDQPLDSDGDKRIDALDYDDDNDGLPSFLESKVDSDNDGLKDYLDTDSDNDGVADGIEAGLLGKDDNHDLIDDAFDAERVGAVDKNGDGIDDNLRLPDHNNDGIPDYLDATYHKKQVIRTVSKKPVSRKTVIGLGGYSQERDNPARLETVEKSTKNLKKVSIDHNKVKLIINRYTDTDNDGLLDSQERMLGTNPLKRDSDDDKVSDAIEIGLDINAPLDSDHDGIIDALDFDDDNDGVLTKNEDINKDGSPINDDTDDDGVPNYLDANDDGDSKLTLEEGDVKDTDNDGVLDYLDKNDGVKDAAPIVVIKKIPEEPEIIVLYDGNSETDLAIDKTIPRIDLASNNAEENDEAIAEIAINQAILKAQSDSKEASGEKPVVAKIEEESKKKRAGVLSWLTSLLPN